MQKKSNDKGIVLTYGTYDLFHIGHVRLFKRLRKMGHKLIVGVSTDEFNALKGKKTIIPFEQRAEIIASLSCVDAVIEEKSWDQKIDDIKKYDVDIFAMGDDWKGKFDDLGDYCKVHYLPRTTDISSTDIKKALTDIYGLKFEDMSKQFEILNHILEDFR